MVVIPRLGVNTEMVVIPRLGVDTEVVVIPRLDMDTEMVMIPRLGMDTEMVVIARLGVDTEMVVIPKHDASFLSFIEYGCRMADWSVLQGSRKDFLSHMSYESDQCLLRMMSNYVDQPYSSQVLSSTMYDENIFCSPDNVDQCITFINQELSAVGFAPLSQDGETQTVSLINVLYKILQQYQKVCRVREELENRCHRASSDLRLTQNTINRIQQEKDKLEGEVAQEKEKHRQAAHKNKILADKLKIEREECKRLQSTIKDRDLQYKHEQKKKLRENNKLTERLHQLLIDKTPERKVGIDMVGSMPGRSGKRSTWKTNEGNNRQEELYRNIIHSYEDKQRELMVENTELRDCLVSMQQELSSVLSRVDISPLSRSTPQNSHIGEVAESSSLTDLNTVSSNQNSEGYYQMPYDLMRDDLQRDFHEVCQKIKERIKKHRAADISGGGKWTSPGKSSTNQADADWSQSELDKLQKQIEKYKKIILEQEELIQQTLHQQSKSVENSFFHESQLLEEKESLAEQRRHFYQEKANFEEERRRFTESVIRFGKERKSLEDEKTTLLKNQFFQMSPFADNQSPTSTKSAKKSQGTRLLPSTPVFSPAPSKVPKTPSTAELYRVLGITYKGSLKRGKSSSSRRLPKSVSTESLNGSVNSRSCKSAPENMSEAASPHPQKLALEEVQEIKKSLFSQKRRSSTGSPNSIE
ncbi:hypothetical protein ACJMK2_042569 [Sinanodonta woodiana]|uniref:Uncharacterized protein n=1 Tax=Sinanodonta woodiana TaxID=1069815 RepID=A0ABD3W7R9_SINWO